MEFSNKNKQCYVPMDDDWERHLRQFTTLCD